MPTPLETRLAEALRFTLSAVTLYNGFGEPGYKALEIYDKRMKESSAGLKVGDAVKLTCECCLGETGVVKELQPNGADVAMDDGETRNGTPFDRLEALTWRCFHCDEVFTNRSAAEEHFGLGDYEFDAPACKLNVLEGGILGLYRETLKELEKYRSEDGEAMRLLYKLGAEHHTALIREEERGYAKGVADMKKQIAEVVAFLIKIDAPNLLLGQYMSDNVKIDRAEFDIGNTHFRELLKLSGYRAE